MAEQKQVKYDVDGYETVTSALMELLNQYPDLDGEEIAFSQLGTESGVAMFPVSGAVVETSRTDVTGKTKEVCLYPFYIIKRGSGLNEKRKLRAKEWLDNLGKWLEKKEISIGTETYRLTDYPSLTGDRKLLSVDRQTPSYLDNTNEDKTEDWAISISARYQYEYYK